jgi:hypothetical protein
MQIKMFAVLAMTVLLVAPTPTVAAGAADQHSGTWKMDPAKSTYNPGLAAKSITLRIDSDENEFKVNSERTDGDGNLTQAVMTVRSTVSNDGKLGRLSSRVEDAQGRDVNNIVVYEKQ